MCPECADPVQDLENHIQHQHGLEYVVKIPATGDMALGRVFRRSTDGHFLCVCGVAFRRTADIDAHMKGVIGDLGTEGSLHYIQNLRGPPPEWCLGF